MKFEHKVILVSVAAGIGFWILDALLDMLFFYQQPFFEILILHIPAHEIYVRLIALAWFVAVGLVMARLLAARSRAERQRDATLEALQASETRYRRLVETSPDAITLTDMEGRITLINRGAATLFGFDDPGEMIGQSAFEFVAPEDQTRALANLRRMLDGEEAHVPEYAMVRRDGSRFFAEVRAAVIQDEAGRPQALINITRDTTARREAEEQLRHYAAALERSNQDLEQFAYAISHDLQEPLRMVTSYLELLKRRYGDRLDDTADEFIAYAVDGAERMQTMIQGLLRLSRISTHARSPTPVDAQQVLAAVLHDLQVAIEESGAVVTYDTLPQVVADEVQLGRVFQNLIHNAIKFRDQTPPHVHISVELWQEDGPEEAGQRDVWCFAICDDGIGFEPEQADRIFQVFGRLHSQATYPGAGVGLAETKKIVERHGGRIWAESEPGRGATFYFTVPAQP